MADSISPRRHRLQFDFNDGAFQELNELQMECGLSSRAETIFQGLRLLSFYRRETLKGNKILIEEKGELKKIVIEELDIDLFGT